VNIGNADLAEKHGIAW